jgi:hypothetical protein
MQRWILGAFALVSLSAIMFISTPLFCQEVFTGTIEKYKVTTINDEVTLILYLVEYNYKFHMLARDAEKYKLITMITDPDVPKFLKKTAALTGQSFEDYIVYQPHIRKGQKITLECDNNYRIISVKKSGVRKKSPAR